MKSSRPRRRMLRNLVFFLLMVLVLCLAIFGVMQHRATRELNVWMASEEYQITRDKLFNRKPLPEDSLLEDMQHNNTVSEDKDDKEVLSSSDILEKLPEGVNAIQALREDAALKEEIAAWLEENEAIFQLLLPSGNISLLVLREDENGYPVPNLEYYSNFRELVRSVMLKSFYEAAQGNSEVSWQWLRQGVRATSQMGEESPLIGSLLMQACNGMMRHTVEELLQQGIFPGTALHEMDIALQTSANIDLFRNTMELELVYSTETHRWQLEQMQGIRALITRPVSNYISGRLFDFERELIEILQQDDVMTRLQSYQALDAEITSTSGLTQQLMPALIHAAQHFERYTIETDILRLGLAAAQYRADFGAYPETIGAIESLLTAPLANPGHYVASMENGTLVLTTTLPKLNPRHDVPRLVLE